MENAQPLGTQKDAEVERAELRARLQREFHIAALFIPVKTVASVLGLSPSTIYAYIRTDSFFLPYRLINKTPMIALDDLVEWCLRCSTSASQVKTSASLVSNTSCADRNKPSPPPRRERILPADRVVAETLAQLGMQSRKRMPRVR